MFNEVSKAIAEIEDAMKAERMSGAALDATLGKARTAELDDEPEEARSLLEKALAQNATGDKSEILLQLARMERRLNEKPAAAVTYSEQAIDALRASRNNFQLIAIRLALARYLATTAIEKVPDARTKAETQLKAAEADMRALSYADGEWRMAMIRGNLAQAAGEDKSAIALYRAAIERLERMRSSLSEGQRQDFSDASDVQELYQRIIGLFSKSGNKEEAWQYLERAKARSFVEMLGARRFKTAKTENTPVLAELQQIERRMADLELELSPTNATLLRSAGREPGIVEAELQGCGPFHRSSATVRGTAIAIRASAVAVPTQPCCIAKTHARRRAAHRVWNC